LQVISDAVEADELDGVSVREALITRHLSPPQPASDPGLSIFFLHKVIHDGDPVA
jgi:hypothetical protein